MYKNRSEGPYRYLIAGLLLLFVACWINGCAKSRSRTDSSDASNPTATEDGRMSRRPDATNEETKIDDFVAPVEDAGSEDFGFDATAPPQEILDELEPLKAPEFREPLEDLAADNCGYIFTAESEITTSEKTYNIVEKRSFNSSGRLIAAELQFSDNVEYFSIPSVVLKRRLQIDYDSMDRPILVRLSPMFQIGGDESEGSVIRIEYESDGSSRSQYITNETERIKISDFDYYHSRRGEAYFCEQLRFDSNGNFVERKWGCINPTVVHERSYDDRHRVISDHGQLLDEDEYRPIPLSWTTVMQINEWRIEYAYDDSNHQSTVNWKEYDQNRQVIYGMVPANEQVEHRIVRTYDETGQQLLTLDYDFGNDGNFDEQTVYTYQDGLLLSKEIDLWRDGVVDITETHTRSANHHRVERRNMTANVDDAFSSISMDEWRDAFTGIASILPSQSQSVTDFTYDNESRPFAINLEMYWLYFLIRENAISSELTPVSESWHETSVYEDAGYVEKKDLVWEPSDALSNAREVDTIRVPESEGSELFGRGENGNATANTTNCTLTPFCEDAEVILPEDMRLLTCEVAFIFPEYQNVVDIPSISRDDYAYVVPPYDSLPGIQNVIKRHHQIYGFPGPPNVRDIIDY